MEYKVIRKEVKTGKIFENVVSQYQLNNITKYPCSLYNLESIELIKGAEKLFFIFHKIYLKNFQKPIVIILLLC